MQIVSIGKRINSSIAANTANNFSSNKIANFISGKPHGRMIPRSKKRDFEDLFIENSQDLADVSALVRLESSE
jgi:hypothetical protein